MYYIKLWITGLRSFDQKWVTRKPFVSVKFRLDIKEYYINSHSALKTKLLAARYD